MAQFLRPDSTVTATSFTNGFAAIDEATASDADFAYGANNTAAVLEVGLSNPAATPGSGTTTVRYRIAKTNAGVVDNTGNPVTVTAEVYQGGTLISSDAARTATGFWTGYSWTPDVSSVTDWTDVRLRFTTSASGGGPSVRRGAAVSWAELEAPDAPAAVTHATSGALAGQIGSVAGSASRASPSVTHATSGALSGQGSTVAGSASRTRQHSASGALTGPGTTLAGSAARFRAFASSGALAGQIGAIAGAAERTGAGGGVSHAATSALAGQGSSVAGSSARVRVFATSGALVGQGASLAGVSALQKIHAATGALAGAGSLITGTAATPVDPVYAPRAFRGVNSSRRAASHRPRRTAISRGR